MKIAIARGASLQKIRRAAYLEGKHLHERSAELYSDLRECTTLTAKRYVKSTSEYQRALERDMGVCEAQSVPIGEALKMVAVSQLISQLRGRAQQLELKEQRAMAAERELEELEELFNGGALVGQGGMIGAFG